MGSLGNRWRQISTRLYLALGFSVLLVLVSGGVGVYSFEQSGDRNYQVRTVYVPVLQAAWAAARESDRLRAAGIALQAEAGSTDPEAQERVVDESVQRMSDSLAVVNGVAELSERAQAANEGMTEVAATVDELARNRQRAQEEAARSEVLRQSIASTADSAGASAQPAADALYRMLEAEDSAALDAAWDEFAALVATGIDPALKGIGEADDGAFATRRSQLSLDGAELSELSGAFLSQGAKLDAAVSKLLDDADQLADSGLESAVKSFDQGRVLLAVIGIAGVAAATLASWLWVGNGIIRRLSRLSDRMRLMAGGDLETPVPEVSQDEIGELAHALEVFRAWALEAQRLNLVEKLNADLRRANEELILLQDRLVAREKLAALGQLVSGVAHEVSNPLNFVQNFSESSIELHDELSELLAKYRGDMGESDVKTLDEIGAELTDSLRRVRSNTGRVMMIVERMRGLAAVGGDPAPTDVHRALRTAAVASCEAFGDQYKDFSIVPTFDFGDSINEAPLVVSEFSEAVRNLVFNACLAMRQKREGQGADYEPALAISTRLVEDAIHVKVRDNGVGIADDILQRIFDPFFTTQDGIVGAGLGLPIAADIARRSGGHITVDTRVGEFAEFTWALPTELHVLQ